MSKNAILLFIQVCFLFFINASGTLPEKHAIGCRWHVGFFSTFLGVLNQLKWCEQNTKTPVVYWPKDGLYYDERGINGITSDNVWDYYFYPVSSLSYEATDNPSYKYTLDGFAVATLPFPFPYVGYDKIIQIYPDRDVRQQMNRLISTYIKIKEPTLDKIESFYKKQIEDVFTVSIHLRGTDKYHEIAPVSLEHIFTEANKYSPCQFYVATDEEQLLEEARKKLNGPVISYDCFRAAQSKQGVHYNIEYPEERSRALLGEEALIDCILLSRCNLMIHTWSNLSISALLFNPGLEHLHLGK